MEINDRDIDLDKEKIFDRYFVDCELADKVCRELKIDRADLTRLSAEIDRERVDDIKEMRRIRSLHSNKNAADMKFPNFNAFYRWYIKTKQEQQECCYYCGTDEKVIADLFEKKYTSVKRPNRGKHLEVERKDASSNEYSSGNCVLACYFCNNDKSDIFSEKEYFEYLKNRKLFFQSEIEKLK